MILGRKGWLHSGYFSRGVERVDYVVRLDTYLMYVRYSGDERFCKGWQTAILNRRYSQFEGKDVWTVSCPFCSTNVHEVLFYEQSLRCKTCLPLGTRWRRQYQLTYRLRAAIREGALSKVQKALQGNPNEQFMAMLAMELTGLAPKRLSSPKKLGPWSQTKNWSIRR